jgi:hypothetical protein
VPDDEILMALEETPFDQITVPVQLLTLRFIVVPVQTILSASSESIVGGFGATFTVIVLLLEKPLVQPFTSQLAA